jgi:hypothetical protein
MARPGVTVVTGDRPAARTRRTRQRAACRAGGGGRRRVLRAARLIEPSVAADRRSSGPAHPGPSSAPWRRAGQPASWPSSPGRMSTACTARTPCSPPGCRRPSCPLRRRGRQDSLGAASAASERGWSASTATRPLGARGAMPTVDARRRASRRAGSRSWPASARPHGRSAPPGSARSRILSGAHGGRFRYDVTTIGGSTVARTNMKTGVDREGVVRRGRTGPRPTR